MVKLGSSGAFLAVSLILSTAVIGQQPITDRFNADPSPHVFAGQYYVYATDNASNSGKYWDSIAWRPFEFGQS